MILYYKNVLQNLRLISFECHVQKYICSVFYQPEKFWLGYEIHLCVWLLWCVFMSANASGTSVRVRAYARACVFAAAVQGCSKHAGKPVTANQARGNHPSAQRREPTIPHFLCLCPFLHYSLDLFFSLSHSFIPPHLYSTFPVIWKCNFVVKKKGNEEQRVTKQSYLIPFVGSSNLYVHLPSPFALICPRNSWQISFTVLPYSSLWGQKKRAAVLM